MTENRTSPNQMVLKLDTFFVPLVRSDSYFQHLRTRYLPAYEQVEGLICCWILRRQRIGYCEFALVSIWNAESDLAKQNLDMSVMRDLFWDALERPGDAYELLAIQPGKSGSDRMVPDRPEHKEGSD